MNTVFPERMSESGDKIEVTVDDNVAAILEWPDRALATIRANGALPQIIETSFGNEDLRGGGDHFHQPGFEDRPIVVFSPERPIPGAAARVQRDVQLLRPALGAWDGDQGIMRAFARQIAGGAGETRGENAARQQHVIEIIDKLYASSATGRNLETLKTHVRAARARRSSSRRGDALAVHPDAMQLQVLVQLHQTGCARRLDPAEISSAQDIPPRETKSSRPPARGSIRCRRDCGTRPAW